MKLEIITHNQIIGFHYWFGAPPEYSYLAERHRHVFDVRCWFSVSHENRDIEINKRQNEVRDALNGFFDSRTGEIEFHNMSCEAIAIWIMKYFSSCVACQVLEDGFGGAYVRK